MKNTPPFSYPNTTLQHNTPTKVGWNIFLIFLNFYPTLVGVFLATSIFLFLFLFLFIKNLITHILPIIRFFKIKFLSQHYQAINIILAVFLNNLFII